MKTVHKQILLFCLCAFMIIPLCACGGKNDDTDIDIDTDTDSVKETSYFLYPIYTYGDVSGVAVDRKSQVDFYVHHDDSKDDAIRFIENWTFKNEGDTERSFLAAFPVSTNYSRPFRLFMEVPGTEPYTLYGGIGNQRGLDECEGTHIEKFTNKEYLKDIYTPIENLGLDEEVIVYEINPLFNNNNKSVDLGFSISYYKEKTKPFLNIEWPYGKNVIIRDTGDRCFLEVEILYDYLKLSNENNMHSIVIFGEDISFSEKNIKAKYSYTGEPIPSENFEVIRTVMTVKEMLDRTVDVSYKSWPNSIPTRESFRKLFYRTFSYYKDNGVPVAIKELAGIEYPYIVWKGQVIPYDKSALNPATNQYYSVFDGYLYEFHDNGFRTGHWDFYDIPLVVNRLCEGVEFRVAEITIPPGEERSMTVDNIRGLQFPFQSGLTRLTVAPVPSDGLKYNSFDIEVNVLDCFNIQDQNLELEMNGDTGTASLDPYRDDYVLVIRKNAE